MKKYLLVALLSLFSLNSWAATSSTTGELSRIFVTASGSVAIQIKGGFTNAKADGQCPAADTSQWAGVAASDSSEIKSTILTAKASGQEVTVAIAGCQGTWYKISYITLN